jgi:hypothetical protein
VLKPPALADAMNASDHSLRQSASFRRGADGQVNDQAAAPIGGYLRTAVD